MTQPLTSLSSELHPGKEPPQDGTRRIWKWIGGAAVASLILAISLVAPDAVRRYQLFKAEEWKPYVRDDTGFIALPSNWDWANEAPANSVLYAFQPLKSVFLRNPSNLRLVVGEPVETVSVSLLNQADIEQLQKMPSLKELHIYGLDPAATSLAPLKVLPELDTLSIQCIEEDCKALSGLPELQHVTKLELQLNSKFDEAEPTSCITEALAASARLPLLSMLDVSIESFPPTALAHLGRCRTLRSLSISYSELAEEHFQEIAKLGQVERLMLFECTISEGALRGLAKSNVSHLWLCFSSRGSNSNTQCQLEGLQSVQSLRFLDYQPLTVTGGAILIGGEKGDEFIPVEAINEILGAPSLCLAVIRQMQGLRSLRYPASIITDCEALAELRDLEQLNLRGVKIECRNSDQWKKLKSLRTVFVDDSLLPSAYPPVGPGVRIEPNDTSWTQWLKEEPRPRAGGGFF